MWSLQLGNIYVVGAAENLHYFLHPGTVPVSAGHMVCFGRIKKTPLEKLIPTRRVWLFLCFVSSVFSSPLHRPYAVKVPFVSPRGLVGTIFRSEMTGLRIRHVRNVSDFENN